jgi:hypothetical protein
MTFINEAKESFNREFHELATKNITRKLAKQGIDPHDLDPDEFSRLIDKEKELLESDTKKVGAGIGIGIVLSMLFGF